MSPSHSRYHIPFPSAFLSLNKPINKASSSGTPTNELAAHNFLSNRPSVPRHSSMSSVSTISAASEPASPPASVVGEPTVVQAPTFLALNRKYSAPPATIKELGVKSNFLSNRV